MTDKYYIGVHSTSNLEDGYLGSGVRIKNSVAKHGADAHDREILREFDSLEQAFEYEASLVCANTINDPLCLNLKEGGSGGWAYEDTKFKASEEGNKKQRLLRDNDPEWSKRFAKTSSDRRKEEHSSGVRDDDRLRWTNLNAEFRARAMSEHSKKKRLATYSEIGHQQGEKNSQFGTCWVSNEIHTVKISKELLSDYLDNGYTRGRKLKTT